MTFMKHELRMNLKSFLIWTLVIAIMIFSFMLMFTTMEGQMQEISDVYSSMGDFSKAFGMDKISFITAMGYYAVEAGSVLSLGGAMFSAIVGIGMLAKEEGGHATEFTFVSPNTRNYFITSKLVAMVVLLAAFDIVCFLFGILGFVAIDGDIEWKQLLLYHVAIFLMYLEISGICFGISAFLKKNNVGLGIGIAVLLYFLNLFANISDKVEKIHYITPFYYSDATGIFTTEKLQGKYIAIGMGLMMIGIAVGYIKYNRKDLSI